MWNTDFLKMVFVCKPLGGRDKQLVAQVQSSGGWGRRIAPSSRPVVLSSEFQGSLGSIGKLCFKRKKKNTVGDEKDTCRVTVTSLPTPREEPEIRQ